MKATMTLNKKILLQKREDNNGYGGGYICTAEKTVCASVQLPGLTLQNNSEFAGRKTDLTVHLWRREFDTAEYTHAVIGGTVYRIDRDGASANDLYVKLSLERG